MLKRTILCVLAVSLVGSVGCAGQLKKKNQALQDQIAALERKEAALLRENDVLKAHAAEVEANLAEARKEARQMSELVDELRGEQQKLQDQRKELEKLVQDLSGITVEPRNEGNFIVMESEILFASGKAELNEAAKGSLDRIAGYLLDKEGLQVRIDGHTDGAPIKFSPWEDNYHLGAMRAHAVMRYLMDRGISAGRMYIVGFGPNRPIVEPESPTDRVAENRRVEILLVPEGIRSISEILEGFGR